MKMKRKIIVMFVCCMLMLSACQSYVNEDETYNNIQNETKADDITSQYASLSEIRESKDEVMEQAYNGKWGNLHFERFDPYLSDEDEIHNISWEDKNYKGLTGIDLFKELLKIVEYYANDYPNGEFIWEDKDEGFRNDWKYSKVEEVLKTGEVPYECDLSYRDKSEKEYYLRNFVSVNSIFNMLIVNHRKITNTALESMIEEGSYIGQGVPGMNEWFLETEKIYLSNATDGSLDDEWQLLDDKMSVRECIAFVEEYMNTEMIYETNPDVRAKVYLVRVLKVTDDIYAYSCMVSRTMYGLTTEVYPSSYGDTQEGIREDGGLVELIEHNGIDYFGYIPLATKIEKKEEPITEIISLDNAFTLLSNRIGENSTYKILSAELGYRLTEHYGDGYNYGEGTPIWRIMTMNENDNKNYVFELDCVTGDIRSRQKKLY